MSISCIGLAQITMIINKYAVRSIKGIPAIFVIDELQSNEPSIAVKFHVGKIPGNETLGTALSIQYCDNETFGEVEDYILPNLPDHFVERIKTNPIFTITDLGCDVQLELTRCNLEVA